MTRKACFSLKKEVELVGPHLKNCYRALQERFKEMVLHFEDKQSIE